MKLNDFAITDFSGGVRNDKSDFDKKDNEVVSMLNFEIDRNGMLKKRRGGHQFGNTATNTIDNSVFWELQTLGAVPTSVHLFNNRDTTSDIYRIVVGTRLNAAVAAGDVTITVISAANFAATGTIEIEGDLITYTGKTANTFTGCAGALAHDNLTAVNQIAAMTGTSVDGRAGLYYAVLGNELFIGGRGRSVYTTDGAALTQITDTDAAAGMFATTYRNRIYVAGANVTDANYVRNGSVIRVSYTEPGDVDDWGDYTANYFDVEEDRGEAIAGLKVTKSDELLIFKTNSFFSYNEVNLKQRSEEVGAYNQHVIQEIDGLIYTFCPTGIFVTNGLETKKISDPIQDYIKDFRPTFATSTIKRVVGNTFATTYKKQYWLYIGDVSSVGSITDVVLVYDTRTKSWSIHTGLTNITHLKGMKSFLYGGETQRTEELFCGDSSGKYYRMFSKSYIDNQTPQVEHFTSTGDIYKDLVSNTGTLISSVLETQYYDLKSPGWIKQFGHLRVIGEGGFHLSYKIEGRKGETAWKPLGETKMQNQRFKFDQEDVGYRMKFRISHASIVSVPTLNALIFEDTNTTTRD